MGKFSLRKEDLIRVVAVAVLLHTFACTETPSSPTQTASITVTVDVKGVDRPAALFIQIDALAPHQVAASQHLTLSSIPPGPHTVALLELPVNCRVDGANPITVDVPANGVVPANFSVSCAATTGVIAIAVDVAGHGGTSWFELDVDESGWVSVEGNRTVFVAPLSSGSHIVTLRSVPGFCHVDGAMSTTVVVKTGGLALDTATARFTITCGPPSFATDTIDTIAFERSGNILLMSENGSEPVVLTSGTKPSWSPDGAFIAFERLHHCSNTGCSSELWLIHPDGMTERRIKAAEEGVYDGHVAVSPDANSIAFLRYQDDTDYLMVSDLAGGSLQTLSIWNPVGAPSWSPDGSEIAVPCSLGLPWALELCVLRTNAGCKSKLPQACVMPVASLVTTIGAETDPAWSPDGNRVAFTLDCSWSECPDGVERRNPYIAVLDRSTGTVTRLVPGTEPAWSRDGTRILFVGNENNPGLRIYNLADGTVKTLTNDPGDRSPSSR